MAVFFELRQQLLRGVEVAVARIDIRELRKEGVWMSGERCCNLQFALSIIESFLLHTDAAQPVMGNVELLMRLDYPLEQPGRVIIAMDIKKVRRKFGPDDG